MPDSLDTISAAYESVLKQTTHNEYFPRLTQRTMLAANRNLKVAIATTYHHLQQLDTEHTLCDELDRLAALRAVKPEQRIIPGHPSLLPAKKHDSLRSELIQAIEEYDDSRYIADFIRAAADQVPETTDPMTMHMHKRSMIIGQYALRIIRAYPIA